MTKHFLLGILLLSAVSLNAQTSGYYQEAPNPVAVNPTLWSEVAQSLVLTRSLSVSRPKPNGWRGIVLRKIWTVISVGH